MRLKVLSFIVLVATACQPAVHTPASHRFDNGVWYRDGAFVADTGYIVDGVLQFSSYDEPLTDASTQTLDLEGGFVVPPYCEAHNHNLGSAFDGIKETSDAYLKDGVYYVMIAGSFPAYREAAREQLSGVDTVDAVFANNGLTGTGGHPRRLREFLMDRFGLYPEFTKETLPDQGYFEADTLDELREKWELILENRPDFIKAMLYFSEEYEARRDNPDYYGNRGLDPDLLPELVRLAHGEDLRVMIHVETDHDMQIALRAGADLIGHLVSHDSTARISDETIALAEEKGAVVITTASVAKRFERRLPERYAAVVEAQADNLRRLHAAGVTVALGSDNSTSTSRGEADHLSALGVFDNASLLNMWTENCSKTVFPERKIGVLEEGYEASFLVLSADPLADFEHTKTITMRVKEGVVLE